MFRLFLLFFIIILINIFWVFGFFAKLAGVQTKKWSTSNSIFQIINLIPRTIGVLQVPLITILAETAIKDGEFLTYFYFQKFIMFNFLGVIIGSIFLPFFLEFLKVLIDKLYLKKSLKGLFWGFNFNEFKFCLDYMHFKIFFNKFSFKFDFKDKFFLNNVFSGFLLIIAFPLCIYVGYLIPAYRATIISSVSVFYGVATFINILLVETKVSVLADQTLFDKSEISEFKSALFSCLKGRIIGIILAIISFPFMSKMIYFVFVHLLNFR